ncbi:amidase family protein, partial [Bordetella pertussis]
MLPTLKQQSLALQEGRDTSSGLTQAALARDRAGHGGFARDVEQILDRDGQAVDGRARDAGAVIVGRTNMTEFAYSGLGLNPHYGTPRNPWDRATGRIPGGSSSGAAVSVTDGMASGAIGSDTGGSVRIPAALCGLAGFKPSAQRVSMQGVLPLSANLDSIGPLAPSVR